MLNHEFVRSFREAAPYINAYRGKIFVLAIHDDMLQQGYFASLAQDISLLVSLGIRIVLVHGIDCQLRRLLRQQDRPDYNSQQSATDAYTLECVKQAVGMIRSTIEALLSMGGVNSSMHGARLRVVSGNFIIARPLGVLNGVDQQFSGCIRRIDQQAIQDHLAEGNLVLLSPIGYSLTGEVFYLQMDALATQVAITLQAEKLVFVTETSRIQQIDGAFVESMTVQQAEAWLATDNTQEEVATIVSHAVRATRGGVNRAYLVGGQADGALLIEHFTRHGRGTMFTRDPLVQIRRASIEDVADIMILIALLETQGVLIKRSKECLELDIDHYFLLEHDGKIYGCVAVYVFPEESSAELACLVVEPSKRDEGFGEILLKYVENEVHKQGVRFLFVLTTQTAHWFIEHGFVESQAAILPASKHARYNAERGSKIFVKGLSNTYPS